MAPPSEVQKILKKIDPSDIRILAVGLILLFVPLVYFFFKVKSPEGGFSSSSVKESLYIGRGGFSFVQKQENAGKSTTGASLYKAAKVDSEWKSAVEAMAQAPLELPAAIQGASPEAKMMYEADMDPELRQANSFLNTNRLNEAMVLYQKVMARDSDNPYVKFYAGSNLCAVYERLGKTEELEKEFRRMIAVMAKLPNLGFKADLTKGMEALSMVNAIMDQVRMDPKCRQFVQGMLEQKGLSGHVTLDSVMAETQKGLGMIPGLTTAK